MNPENLEKILLNLISYSGTSKSLLMEAIFLAKNNQIDKAEKKIDEANQLILEAHHLQTELITLDSDDNNKVPINILMIHAQDHLMNSVLLLDLAKEFIDLYRILNNSIKKD